MLTIVMENDQQIPISDEYAPELYAAYSQWLETAEGTRAAEEKWTAVLDAAQDYTQNHHYPNTDVRDVI